MADVNYEDWYKHTLAVFNKYDIKPKSILELACGTGNMTNRFARNGYKIVGTDISNDMLMIAQDKAYDSNLKVEYLFQDMTQITYKKKVDLILSYCDGLNYIDGYGELEKVFAGAEKLLESQGYFIFDISSYYKLSTVIGDNKFMESHDDVVYIWENFFDAQTGKLNMELDIFMRCDEFDEEDIFERVHESHLQRAYKRDELKAFIENNGFQVLDIINTDTMEAVDNHTERELYICRKRQ